MSKAERPGITIQVEDEVEALRISQDQSYWRNRAALGAPSLSLINAYSDLYVLLWSMATQRVPLPLTNDVLFTHQMLLEAKADLIRTMLLLIRGHITEAHAKTRRAIECAVWARRIRGKSDLAQEWLTIDANTPPSRKWRESIGAKELFPPNSTTSIELKNRYQITSRCLHPFRFSFTDRLSVEHREGGEISLQYSFFESEEARKLIPTHFLWTLQTHDLIIAVFEEVFAGEIAQDSERWKALKAVVLDGQTKVGRFWIEVTQREEQRQKENPAPPSTP